MERPISSLVACAILKIITDIVQRVRSSFSRFGMSKKQKF